ncbi:MAG: hypothetical protein ACE37F_14260 [Nannocystaceae bacterium]|nr:hypothetical protein [bacterium]
MNRSETITQGDAEFLGRIYDIESPAGIYLEGPDRVRARRMYKLGMVASGRLDPKRYAVLTRKGETFVERMRGGR